jgi:hypothetical protein
MAKVASSATTKRTGAAKNATAAAKPRSRSAKEITETPLAPDPVLALPPTTDPTVESLQLLTERFNALEEKITASVSALTTAVQTRQSTEATPSSENAPPPETVLPVIADVIRRSLVEQLNPLIASLKRIEERVGFMSNRLKHPGPNPEQRQKPPWRHDQQQRNRPPRGPSGPRPTQGPPWSPPNAASVQGHFAPRPLRGGEPEHFAEDEE